MDDFAERRRRVLFLPLAIQQFLCKLEAAGYAAYAVGGCVRDLLMDKAPHDWDVTTSGRPEEILSLFGGCAIPTGLRHGTVTVLWQGISIEVTTFRTETAYFDHRHPDAVVFAPTLEEDLCRRDFTVNAMALDARGKLIDLWGGTEDLKSGILRCVGDPEQRFAEDALRMLRCLRFASVLGFSIDAATAGSLHRHRSELQFVSAERLSSELCKLICGAYMAPVLLEYPDVLGVFLPEILPCVGFEQRNGHHIYTVWEHMVHSAEHIAPETVLRLAMLLHDIGKPDCFTSDAAGVGHFYGHARRSAELAQEVCRRLRLDNATAQQVVTLVRWHDREVQCTPAAVKRATNRLGVDVLRQLAAVKRADNLAQHPAYRGRQQEIDAVMALLDEVLAQDACFSLRQLAVGGNDLLAIGLSGKAIGAALEELLQRVIDGELPNEKAPLLQYISNNAPRE